MTGQVYLSLSFLFFSFLNEGCGTFLSILRSDKKTSQIRVLTYIPISIPMVHKIACGIFLNMSSFLQLEPIITSRDRIR